MPDEVHVSREGLWYLYRRFPSDPLTAIQLDWGPLENDELNIGRLNLMVLRARLQYALDEVNKELRDGRGQASTL